MRMLMIAAVLFVSLCACGKPTPEGSKEKTVPKSEQHAERAGHDISNDAGGNTEREPLLREESSPGEQRTERQLEMGPADGGETRKEAHPQETTSEPTPEKPATDVVPERAPTFRDVPLKSSITDVQPMTGLVLWTDNGKNKTTDIQLEYSYMKYGDVVSKKGVYDWSKLEALLNDVAKRKHQAVVRYYFAYPGQKTTVPQYIKDRSDYTETKGQSEGKTTFFPDWTNKTLQDFVLEFHQKFAAKYDQDPRLAFLQVGFGLWAEYHIYDGPMKLGSTFPSKTYQSTFLKHMSQTYKSLTWSLSIDSADTSRSPVVGTSGLLKLAFGLFDDSFLHKNHSKYNADSFKALGLDRYKNSPIGGELSYYTDFDQKHALDAKGPHGTSFEALSGQYHVSYMIGDGQPDHQPMSRIKSAGLALGYKFKILSFKRTETSAKIVVQNTGIAPIYYDAYLAVNGTKSTKSLKHLLPGSKSEHTIAVTGKTLSLTIECARLVAGQRIQFEANL